MNRIRITSLIAGLLAMTALAVAGCGSDDGDATAGGGGGEVALVAYSTPQQAYEDAVIPGFQETADGEGVEFSTSFGASGDQRRAVEGDCRPTSSPTPCSPT